MDKYFNYLREVDHILISSCPTNIGTLYNVTVNSPKVLDYGITLLHENGIKLYGYKRTSPWTRKFKELTEDELAPHLKHFDVCTSKSGKKFLRARRSQKEKR